LRRPPHSPLFPYTTLFRSEPPPNDAPCDCFHYRIVGARNRIAVSAVVLVHTDRFCSPLPNEGFPIYRHEKSQSSSNLLKRLKSRSEEHTSELQSRENLVCR